MLAMTANGPNRQPGDVILDHYMPNAPDAEREAARENLRALVRALIRINHRLATDARDEVL